MNIALDIGHANNTAPVETGVKNTLWPRPLLVIWPPCCGSTARRHRHRLPRLSGDDLVRHREGHQRGELRHILSVRSDSSDSPYGPRGSHLLLP